MVSYEKIDEILILHVVIVTVILLYMFLTGNYAGQEITEHNDHVFFVA